MPNFQAISRQRHAQQYWTRDARYGFAATNAVIPVSAAELPKAAMSLPIGFIEQEGAFVPVAVLGLQPGKNLFVAADGRWVGGYLPDAFRSYPFRLAPDQNGQQVLCIDEDSGLVTDGPAAETFFTVDGQPAPALLDILNALSQTEQNRRATVALCALLQKHNLMRPWPLTLQTDAGTQQITGLFQIDETALNQLPAQALLEVRQAGALPMAYCQLLSMQHLPLLGEMIAAQAQAVAQPRPNQHNTQVAPLALPLQSTETATLPPSAPKVLLVTFDWSTLTEMPYLVKQAGCQVDVLCPSHNWTIKNGFYDNWIDSGASMDTLIAALIKLASDNIYHYILLGDDPILWKIYTENIVALRHLLPIRNPAALPILNKVGFAEHCRNHAIPSPAFQRIDCKEAASEALQLLGLPVVVKVNYSNGGNGVSIFRDEATYHAYTAAHDYCEPLLAQQCIDGIQFGVEALFKNGTLLEYVCSVDIEPTLGPSSKRRYLPNDEKIGTILSLLGKSAVLHGFANISLMQETASQDYYLIESDPRPTKWVPYARWFGHDFAVAFKAFLVDGESGGDMASDTLSCDDVDCWEVEFFPDHVSRLLNAGRSKDVLLHLLDFGRNYRYIIYDPVLFAAKMAYLRENLKFT